MLLEATLQKELLCNFAHKVILKIEPVLKSVHNWTENNHNTNKCGEIEFQQAKVFNNTLEWKIIFWVGSKGRQLRGATKRKLGSAPKVKTMNACVHSCPWAKALSRLQNQTLYMEYILHFLCCYSYKVILVIKNNELTVIYHEAKEIGISIKFVNTHPQETNDGQ